MDLETGIFLTNQQTYLRHGQIIGYGHPKSDTKKPSNPAGCSYITMAGLFILKRVFLAIDR